MRYKILKGEFKKDTKRKKKNKADAYLRSFPNKRRPLLARAQITTRTRLRRIVEVATVRCCHVQLQQNKNQGKEKVRKIMETEQSALSSLSCRATLLDAKPLDERSEVVGAISTVRALDAMI